MTETEISLPSPINADAVLQAIREACAETGLIITLETTLSRYPGKRFGTNRQSSLHFHCKRGKERGTLEITFWERQPRLYLAVQSGRRAEWTDAATAALKLALGRRLSVGIPIIPPR